MHHVLAVLLAATLLLLPAAAFAGEDEAQAFFEEGAALYYQGKYAEALVEFKKAHASSPNAMFQYNIAMCHVHLKRWNEAVEAARAARRMGGLGPKGATQNEARITAVHSVLSTLAVADQVAANQPAEVAETSIEPAETVETETSFEPEKQGGFGTLGWVGVGTTVVGAGLLAGALVSEITLQPTWDEYREAADTNDAARFDTLKEKIESRQTIGQVLLFSGIGLTAVGATLIIVELATGKSGDTAAAVYPLPGGGAAASLSLRF